MPRSKSNVKRVPIDKENLGNVIKLLKENKISLRKASVQYAISRTTLRRHLKYCLETGTDVSNLHDHLAVKKVFSEEEEKILVKYLKQSAQLHYGLSLQNVQKLAYRFAVENKKKYPSQWDKNQMAGDYWLRLFRKRHNNELSLRKPEATSLARSTAFNKTNIELTFNNFKQALAKCPNLKATDLWNLDETGNSTVHVPPKMLAPKGVKQIGAMTSAERGSLVTMIAAINAGGGSIPPMLIFPRVNFKPHMLAGAPEGTIGGANPSGWSNEATFLQFFKHFIDYVKPSKDHPVILLLDNHESHIQLSVIDLARANGVILVTFHPHTSHKLQPLDKTVFGPFKKYFNTAANELMLTPGHIGKPLTIYDIASLVGKAFPLAFTPINITQGFKSTGLHPLNENIFDDHDFLASNVTDRPFYECDVEHSILEDCHCNLNSVPKDTRQVFSEDLETSIPKTTQPNCKLMEKSQL